uniref:Uncharacterized protein n=1 Tax=Rhizophora mucronata TaxID=61149 RepID=A0A2P2J4M5_RHIMU
MWVSGCLRFWYAGEANEHVCVFLLQSLLEEFFILILNFTDQ